MNNIINYLLQSLKPVNSTEFIMLDNFNEEHFNLMRQDGIMLIKNTENNISNDIDWVVINNFTLVRKNKPLQIEWLNNDGTMSFDLTREPMYRRLIPPPYENINHAFIIANIIKETNGKNKNYIEYGVRNGDCIKIISNEINIAYGIDILDYKNENPNIKKYIMDTDTFSNKYLPNIEYHYAFIDADHKSKQVVIDFEYLYKYIKTGGFIFLHDTYPCMIENLLPSACNDCYLSPIVIKQRYPLIEILTLPINPGLTIIRKN